MKLKLLSIRRLKFRPKLGQIKKYLRRFSVSCCVVSQTAILYSKCQLLSDSSRVHPSIQHFYRNDVLRKHHTRKHPDTKYDIPSTYTCFHYEGNYRKDAPTHSTTSTAFREPEETVHDLHDDSPVCPADLVASLSSLQNHF